MSNYLFQVEEEARQLRAEVYRLTAELAEANSLMQAACKDSNLKALDLEQLRAQEPVAEIRRNGHDGHFIEWIDGDASTYSEGTKLYARPVPAAQAVPDGLNDVVDAAQQSIDELNKARRIDPALLHEPFDLPIRLQQRSYAAAQQPTTTDGEALLYAEEAKRGGS